jgi:uncharacterized protein with NRDE domain
MCLIFLSINNHPNYKLIIAANRDEFYARKTAPADYWSDHSNILGGRDLEASGTWMAINRNGRIGMVTNYRDLTNLKQVAPSRGALVSDFLLSEVGTVGYLKNIEIKAKDYNGFNLLVGNTDELWYLSNYKTGIEKIPDGIHGLSNALLNTPWPKVEQGKMNFKDVTNSDTILPETLFQLLLNEQQAADTRLPNTGVGIERERLLSSMFIKSSGYGTRCSTVVLIDRKDNVLFSERVYDLTNFTHTTTNFTFSVER